MTGVLRPAAPDDVPALVEVQRVGAVRGLGHIFPQDAHPFPRDEIESRWLGEIADPDIDAYVIVDAEGRIVGFAATRRDELLHFGTAVATWGSGLAAVAHDEVIGRLLAAGLARARLRVFEENRRARRFYEKLGWRETGQRSQTSFPPNPVLVEYARDLSGTREAGP